jgi:hypothetical protein
MRRMLSVATGILVAVYAAGARVQGDAQTPDADEWGKLVEANNLDVKGNAPFHLAMTFQMYDLKGKPAESGSFETWWTAPGKQRTVVHFAGLNENGTAPEGASASLVRDSILVGQLLEAAVRPVPKVLSPAGIVTGTNKFGKIQLDCTGPKFSPAETFNAQPATVCVEPHTTDVVLLQGLGGKEIMVRPRTGKFHDTYVALDLDLGYLGRDAIVGKMTIMQAYDSTNLEAEPSAAMTSAPSVARVAGGVISGYRIKFTEPTYPLEAKLAHLSGSRVATCCDREGRVDSASSADCEHRPYVHRCGYRGRSAVEVFTVSAEW